MGRALAALLALASVAGGAQEEEPLESLPSAIRVGHYVEAKGELVGPDRFVAGDLEIQQPDDDDELIGTARRVEVTAGSFEVLGQPVFVDEDTEWKDGLWLGALEGERIEVEGDWKGRERFTAEEIALRNPGRDRISGRVDDVRAVAGGYELRVMRWRVFLDEDEDVEHEVPLAEIDLAPPRIVAPDRVARDEDDLFGAGFALTETLLFTGQVEWESQLEENFDLDEEDPEDRGDHALALRARFVWQPLPSFAGVFTLKHRELYRDDEEDGTEWSRDTELGETYGYWSDLLGPGADVAVGRQDFDDEREWVYDEDLDAARVLVRRGAWWSDFAVSKILDEDDKEEESLNASAYVARERDDRVLAAWALGRDFDERDEQRLHLGLRTYGEWLPDSESWLDLGGLVGDRGDTDLLGWGFDVGTTWEPDAAGPFYFTAGYAFGNGDDDPDDGKDDTFRQTGFQDNNAKFGGVTSFRYYGELLDPELANLEVLTLGVGVHIARRTSLDLVWHHYRQDVARDVLFEAEVDDPEGEDNDIGQEIDLILGSRRFASWDLELVGGWFDPGDAFEQRDDAFLAKIQVRYRF